MYETKFMTQNKNKELLKTCFLYEKQLLNEMIKNPTETKFKKKIIQNYFFKVQFFLEQQLSCSVQNKKNTRNLKKTC